MFWIITQGEYADLVNVGVFQGTQDEVEQVVADLNESRKYVDPYDPEEVVQYRGGVYACEASKPIRSAADVTEPSDGPVQYCYFVAYSHSRGFANAKITMGEPISGMADINRISDHALPHDSPVILYWHLLGTTQVS